MAKFCYLMTGIILLPLWCASCNDNNPRKEIQKIVKEWVGKTVLLPQDIQPTSYSCDTVCDPAKSKKPFRILNFTDSIGCTSCKLKLLTWNAYVREIDTTLADKVDFLFYFHPQNERELGLILRADGFELPFYIDRENEIDRLNGFPKNQACQCFLLDSTNKVLLVGNPTHKPRLWELYKEIISGKKADRVPTTDIHIARPEIEVPDLRIGSTAQAAFVLENTGGQTAGNNPHRRLLRVYETVMEPEPRHARREIRNQSGDNPRQGRGFRQDIAGLLQYGRRQHFAEDHRYGRGIIIGKNEGGELPREKTRFLRPAAKSRKRKGGCAKIVN